MGTNNGHRKPIPSNLEGVLKYTDTIANKEVLKEYIKQLDIDDVKKIYVGTRDSDNGMYYKFLQYFDDLLSLSLHYLSLPSIGFEDIRITYIDGLVGIIDIPDPYDMSTCIRIYIDYAY